MSGGADRADRAGPGLAALVAELAAHDPSDQMKLLERVPHGVVRTLESHWFLWAHPGQYAPPGDWRVWLIRAGRGFGKTRAGAEWVSELARGHPKRRIALVGATADDVRRVMIEGESGLIAVARDDEPITFRREAGEVRFASGAVAAVFSAAAPEGLRGPEHEAAWCDELAKWRYGDAAWDNLMLGMRIGDHPRVLVTTTPRPNTLMRRVMAQHGTIETRGTTHDNPYLPASFVQAMEDLYGGTQLGRQEIDGELIEDLAGALWTRGTLEACRVAECPATVRVVVAVDPPAGTASGAGGDACGIVAVALGADGLGYVVADASVTDASPEGWARAVATCAARVGADRVVAEVNQGGRMVESVLRAADAALPLSFVRASVGKVARAEPVAALYEKRRVRHVGVFRALEDELCALIAGGGYHGSGSPDRADALVYALTELMLGARGTASVRGL